MLALVVRAANRPADYDSDDEFINPRQGVRQPLIRPAPPATGVPVAGTVDQRPSRSDAWSARMREKVRSLLPEYFPNVIISCDDQFGSLENGFFLAVLLLILW